MTVLLSLVDSSIFLLIFTKFVELCIFCLSSRYIYFISVRVFIGSELDESLLRGVTRILQTHS